jgi:ParB-like chromosome segregation protein Spo0J
MVSQVDTRVEQWPIEKLIFYARNPRKNDPAVDRMCGSIREFGFKIPVLARSDGEVVDGHLRLKAARKLGITEIPVLLCDEWTPQQVKAFRLMVNRSVSWADWDEELLSLELQDLNAEDFDLSLTGFNPAEIDALLAIPDEERADATPPVPESPISRAGDLWICGKHRVLSGNSTSAADVARLLGDRPQADPDGHRSTLRHRIGFGVARSCRPERARGRRAQLHEKANRWAHRNHDLRRHARRLVRSVRAGAELANRLCLARQQVHPRGAQRSLADRLRTSPANHLGQGPNGSHENSLLVPA